MPKRRMTERVIAALSPSKKLPRSRRFNYEGFRGCQKKGGLLLRNSNAREIFSADKGEQAKE